MTARLRARGGTSAKTRRGFLADPSQVNSASTWWRQSPTYEPESVNEDDGVARAVVMFPDGRVVRRLPANNPELCLEQVGEEQARCVSRVNAWTGDMGFVLPCFRVPVRNRRSRR